MTNEPGGVAAEPCLLVRAEDGSAYAILKSIVEAHRLSDEQRAELEARLTADGDHDTAGHQFIGTFPPFVYVRWADTTPFAMYKITPQQARDPKQNIDAGYHPPLH